MEKLGGFEEKGRRVEVKVNFPRVSATKLLSFYQFKTQTVFYFEGGLAF